MNAPTSRRPRSRAAFTLVEVIVVMTVVVIIGGIAWANFGRTLGSATTSTAKAKLEAAAVIEEREWRTLGAFVDAAGLSGLDRDQDYASGPVTDSNTVSVALGTYEGGDAVALATFGGSKSTCTGLILWDDDGDLTRTTTEYTATAGCSAQAVLQR